MRGEILGTAAYMSPEQARGGSVGPQTDIWAFAACLFEALTGQGAFAADTAADSMAKVLQVEPPWGALPADVPWSVQRVLRRCLKKSRRERLKDIADARLELEEALSEEHSDLHPDGEHIVAVGFEASPPQTLRLIVNWPEELLRSSDQSQ